MQRSVTPDDALRRSLEQQAYKLAMQGLPPPPLPAGAITVDSAVGHMLNLSYENDGLRKELNSRGSRKSQFATVDELEKTWQGQIPDSLLTTPRTDTPPIDSAQEDPEIRPSIRIEGTQDSSVGMIRDITVVLLGLDSSGKTSILNTLRTGQPGATIPTVGFSTEKIPYRNHAIVMWDVGGQEKLRHYWSNFLQNTDAIIFVVDTADHERLQETKVELEKIEQATPPTTPILILANKQDINSAVPVTSLLSFYSFANTRQWLLRGCSCEDVSGLIEGLDWVINAINKHIAETEEIPIYDSRNATLVAQRSNTPVNVPSLSSTTMMAAKQDSDPFLVTGGTEDKTKHRPLSRDSQLSKSNEEKWWGSKGPPPPAPPPPPVPDGSPSSSNGPEASPTQQSSGLLAGSPLAAMVSSPILAGSSSPSAQLAPNNNSGVGSITPQQMQIIAQQREEMLAELRKGRHPQQPVVFKARSFPEDEYDPEMKVIHSILADDPRQRMTADPLGPLPPLHTADTTVDVPLFEFYTNTEKKRGWGVVHNAGQTLDARMGRCHGIAAQGFRGDVVDVKLVFEVNDGWAKFGISAHDHSKFSVQNTWGFSRYQLSYFKNGYVWLCNKINAKRGKTLRLLMDMAGETRTLILMEDDRQRFRMEGIPANLILYPVVEAECTVVTGLFTPGVHALRAFNVGIQDEAKGRGPVDVMDVKPTAETTGTSWRRKFRSNRKQKVRDKLLQEQAELDITPFDGNQ
eukprot:TRINITY_DN103035_c0_g1_i1.p1 TRINITY_DN103035_c0_g1~~TRINITY_DN103035_c0_g1_i1.p1  ORF type:complete len:743 (+),score=79.72 TRINITY_DN103035_c0_g1_i1:82-2310(+)